MYKLLYKASVEKELRQLPQSERVKIIKKIRLLPSDPRPKGSVKLQGSINLYRLRQGDYRIVYQIEKRELIIIIVKIGHRRDVYQELPK